MVFKEGSTSHGRITGRQLSCAVKRADGGGRTEQEGAKRKVYGGRLTSRRGRPAGQKQRQGP